MHTLKSTDQTFFQVSPPCMFAQRHALPPSRHILGGGGCQVKCCVGQRACFSSWLALCPHQQAPSSKATNAGLSVDSVPDNELLSASRGAPPLVRLPVPLKNRSAARAKVNLAVGLRRQLPPRPCVTENRLRGINTSASGSVDRGVCVCVCLLSAVVCVCPLMMGTEERGQMTRFEREVLCSQSIIFREESRRIKVASCHFRDVRQIPADRVNIAVRVCVPSPLCPPYPSLRQPVPLCCYFNLPFFLFFF